MLTPIEIQGNTFKNSGMGYSKADVDSRIGGQTGVYFGP